MHALSKLLMLFLIIHGLSACSWWSDSDEEAGTEDVVKEEEVLSPEDQREITIDRLLEKGLLAYETDRLSLPAEDSAIYYYREVLKLEPNNMVAQRGLDKVVSRYLQLAKVAHGNGDKKGAQSWLKRAAEVKGGGSRVNAVSAKIKNTRGGQNKNEIEFLPANDYMLSREALDERGAEIQARLRKIARRAQERSQGVLVLARSDEEGRWIISELKQAVPGYALPYRMVETSKPAVVLVSPSKLSESDKLREASLDPAQVNAAKKKLEAKKLKANLQTGVGDKE
jgi:hypothetical protein